MTESASRIEKAVSLDGEFDKVKLVVSDLADHQRKRAYAEWLTQHGDSRGHS